MSSVLNPSSLLGGKQKEQQMTPLASAAGPLLSNKPPKPPKPQKPPKPRKSSKANRVSAQFRSILKSSSEKTSLAHANALKHRPKYGTDDTEAADIQRQCAAAWGTIMTSLRSLNVDVPLPGDPALGATLNEQIKNERNRISQRVNQGLSGLGLAYGTGRGDGQTDDESDGTQASCCSVVGPEPIDGSLVLTMERTLYAALNQAWLVVISGVGFMSIGAQGDNFPNFIGFMLILAGALFAAGSYIIHVRRLRAFTRNEPIGSMTSVVFTGTLVATIVISLSFELYYSVLYPFLDRAAAVSITNLGASNTTLD